MGHTVGVSKLWVDPTFLQGLPQESFLGGLFGPIDTSPGDIGLLLLDDELPYDFLPMATSENGPPPGRAAARLFGWRISPQDEPVLWQAPTTVVDDDGCMQRAADSMRFMPPRLHGIRYDPNAYLCAGADEQAVPLRASDSGAPLVVDGRLTGVAAWSPGADPTLPDYYARVATYERTLTKLIETAGPAKAR